MGYSINKIINIAKNLIFVPKCVACDERLSPIPDKFGSTYGKICFCSKCEEKWKSAIAETCAVCSCTSEKCRCNLDFFIKRQPRVPSVCFYHPNPNDVASKAILTMKRVNTSDLFCLAAIELYPKIRSMLNEMGISENECIFTWMPRKRSSIVKYGFDQGEELASALAKMFNSYHCSLFIHLGRKEQKHLDKQERGVNAEASIILNSALLSSRIKTTDKDIYAFLEGKKVIIIDDVLTSGATLTHGVKLLEGAGAEKVMVACVAKSVIDTKI